MSTMHLFLACSLTWHIARSALLQESLGPLPLSLDIPIPTPTLPIASLISEIPISSALAPISSLVSDLPISLSLIPQTSIDAITSSRVPLQLNGDGEPQISVAIPVGTFTPLLPELSLPLQLASLTSIIPGITLPSLITIPTESPLPNPLSTAESDKPLLPTRPQPSNPTSTEATSTEVTSQEVPSTLIPSSRQKSTAVQSSSLTLSSARPAASEVDAISILRSALLPFATPISASGIKSSIPASSLGQPAIRPSTANGQTLGITTKPRSGTSPTASPSTPKSSIPSKITVQSILSNKISATSKTSQISIFSGRHTAKTSDVRSNDRSSSRPLIPTKVAASTAIKSAETDVVTAPLIKPTSTPLTSEIASTTPLESSTTSPDSAVATDSSSTSQEDTGAPLNNAAAKAGSPTKTALPTSTATEAVAPPPVNGLSKSGQIGVGVGIGVPSAALVVVAAVMFAAQKSRKRSASYPGPGHPSEKDGFLGAGGNGTRSLFGGAGYSKFSDKDSLLGQSGAARPAKTVYDSGSFAISSPIPGSFRKNVILPSPLSRHVMTHSPLSQDEDDDLEQRSSLDRKDWPLQVRARSFLSGLGIGINQSQPLIDEEAAAANDKTAVRAYPEVAVLYDPPLPTAAFHRKPEAVPMPPPFSPRRGPLQRPTSAVLLKNPSARAASWSSQPTLPVLEPILEPARKMRSVPQLRIDTTRRNAQSFSVPMRKPLGVDTVPPLRLGAVSRGSATTNRLPSVNGEAASLSSTGTSITSSLDEKEVSLRTESETSSAPISARTSSMVSSQSSEQPQPQQQKQQQQQQQQEADPTAFSALRRSKAIRRTSTNGSTISSTAGSQRLRRAPSTVYSPVNDDDEDNERRIESLRNLTTSGDAQSPVMSPDDVERNVADFRELARGRSMRSCTN